MRAPAVDWDALRTKPTYVYRAWSADGRLLYVGMAVVVPAVAVLANAEGPPHPEG